MTELCEDEGCPNHGTPHVCVSEICRHISDELTDSTPCPRCNETGLYRDSADVGVGIIYGPYGCPCCGWSENEEYDLQKGGGLQDDGGYLDPYGGYWPKDNPVSKMMRAAE